MARGASGLRVEPPLAGDLYWIECEPPGRLAIAARPRAGDWLEDELRAWVRQGANVIVSLLEPHEIAELDLGEEEALCASLGLTFLNFGIPDRGVPANSAAAVALAVDLGQRIDSGAGVAIHCRAGIGRSATIAALVLKTMGVQVEEGLKRVAIARGLSVPDTPEQSTWLGNLEL